MSAGSEIVDSKEFVMNMNMNVVGSDVQNISNNGINNNNNNITDSNQNTHGSNCASSSSQNVYHQYLTITQDPYPPLSSSPEFLDSNMYEPLNSIMDCIDITDMPSLENNNNNNANENSRDKYERKKSSH